MPKRKTEKKYPGRQNDDCPSEMGEDMETSSVISNVSSGSTYMDIAPNAELDAEGTRQLLLNNINTQVDNLGEKRTETRLKALTTLSKIFKGHYLDLEDDWSYSGTFLEAIDRSLRKGDPVEQAVAARLLAIFGVQNDPKVVTEWIPKFFPTLMKLLRAPDVACATRAAAISAVAMISFLSLDDNYDKLGETLGHFAAVFHGSYLKGDKSVPNIPSAVADMHIAALEGWALLFTTVPASLVDKFSAPIINRMPDFLDSHHVSVRIVGGEVLALIYERIRTDVNPRYRGNNFPILLEKLEGLAKDGTKHRTKVDRKRQRVSFRDVLSTIESRESVVEPPIRFGKESLELSDWHSKRCYDSMCSLLGSGMNSHLKENFLVRDIFSLGDPLPDDAEAVLKGRDNKNQRRLANQASEKMRSQKRKPHRGKRFDYVPCDD